MHSPLYYRSQATIARRLASKHANEVLSEFLNQTSKDYEEMALELENKSGAGKIRHPGSDAAEPAVSYSGISGLI